MIKELVCTFSAGTCKGVSNMALDTASVRLGFDFPGRLREFYQTTNGLIIHERRLVLNDLEKAVIYATALARFDIAHQFGLFPLTESNDSNPYCLACKQPLVGRVIHVRHDDTWRLAFRDLDQFTGALIDLTRPPNWIIDSLVYGYASDHSDRTSEDDAAGDAILDLCKSGNCEYDAFLLIAMSLFSKNRIHRVIGFLQHESMWTREEAAVQLGNMGDVRAIEPLKRLANAHAGRQDGRAARNALMKLRKTYQGDSANGLSGESQSPP
jgi:hypothetical protein